MKETYRCWAEIDRAALRHNAKVVRDRIGSAEMLAVVKADAYGHGLVGVAETLADEAQLFGVANLQEALRLRESLPHPVVILGPATPEERPVIAEHGFVPTISSLEEAEAFDRLKPTSVNFKIDTGMCIDVIDLGRGDLRALESSLHCLSRSDARWLRLCNVKVVGGNPVTDDFGENRRPALASEVEIFQG